MKGVSEEQLLAYAEFGESQTTDFAAYRDASHLAREILRLRAALVKEKAKK